MKELIEILMDMELLEMKSAKELGVGVGYSILRVPGGWCFMWTDTSCYVPEPKIEKVAVKAAPAKRTRKTKKS
jgi:hypothetical protein